MVVRIKPEFGFERVASLPNRATSERSFSDKAPIPNLSMLSTSITS